MEYVTVRLHNGAALSGGAARLLVGYALRRRGRDCWSAVSAELFRGRRETLLIARPFAPFPNSHHIIELFFRILSRFHCYSNIRKRATVF